MNLIKLLIISLALTFAVEGLAQRELSVLTWNTYMLPAIARKTKQVDRAKLIGEQINNSDHDVVCLQETFHKRARKKIIEALKNKYPFYKRANKNSLFKVSSGLMIFSKYPIVEHYFEKYKEKTSIERYAKKGLQRVIIELSPGEKIQVFNTHLQAKSNDKCKEVRKTQVLQIKNQILPNYPTIFCGDFNIHKNDKESYHHLKTNLNAKDGNFISETKITGGDPTNDLRHGRSANDKGKVIDYILEYQNDLIEVYDRETKKIVIDGQTLSDHNLVQAKIKIYEKKNSSR